MAIANNLTTSEEFYALSSDGVRRELVEGHIQLMSPATPKHSWLGARLLRLVGNHAEQQQCGEVFDATAGYITSRNPDTVLEPDVSFVRSHRIANVFRERGFAPEPPDLVIEIISPSQTRKEQLEKAKRWIKAGCELVWVVDPETNQVVVLQGDSHLVLSEGQDLTASNLLPGFTLSFEHLFRLPK
jgi:Uma2 family endonuclease